MRPARLHVTLGLLLLGGPTAPARAQDIPAPPPPLPIPPPTSQPDGGLDLSLARRIEQAHGAAHWKTQRALALDLTLEFGDEVGLQGSLLYDLQRGRVRLQIKDGPLLVFDGRTAWVAPAAEEFANARFNLLTWPWFVAAPFKLRDPGTTLEPQRTRPLRERLCPTARLTFAPGTGDSPEDWYLLYLDPASQRLLAMAYIITYGRSRDEAEKSPHLIQYDAYTSIGGSLIATRWTFFDWSAESGPGVTPIGQGRLENIRFVDPEADAFDRPADSRADPHPASG
jgi:hypothetical protein